jgi:hypothetical protein
VGGRIRGEIQSDHERPNVYFYPGYKYQLHSLGRKWERIPTLPSRTGTGLSFDAEIDNYCALPMFYYFVKLEVPPAGLQIRRLSFVTERQSAPKALPYLALGGNTFCVYGKRDVDWGNFSVTREKNGDEMRSLVRTDNGLEITFIYQENDEPPPLLKGTGQDVGQDATLRWSFEHPKGEKIVKYHAQVSRRADFRWPLATNFDLETQEDHLVVEGSWLCPGDTYYWRVRAQDAKGNWSAFSAARKFKYPPPSPAP